MERKCVILHSAGFGDLIMFSPVLRILRKFGYKLFLFTRDRFSYELAKLYMEDGVFEEVVFVDYVRSISGFLSLLFKNNFLIKPNLILSTTGFWSIKAEVAFLLLRGDSKILRTTKSKTYLFKNFVMYDYFGKHQVEQNLDLLEKSLNITIDRTKIELMLPSSLERFKTNRSDKKSILIHPGSSKGGEVRRYPLSRFINIASNLMKRGLEVAFILGPAEFELKSYIENAGLKYYMTSDLLEVSRVICNYHFFLNSDSGLGHLAAALDRHVFTIFGPANPQLTRPYTEKVTVIETEKKLECRPCIAPNRKFGCSNPECLISINEDKILEKIENFLK